MAKPKKKSELIYEDDFLRSKYSVDEIKFCIAKLEEARMIECSKRSERENRSLPAFICGLTYDGENFASYISNDEVWSTVKATAGNIERMPILDMSIFAHNVFLCKLRREIWCENCLVK